MISTAGDKSRSSEMTSRRKFIGLCVISIVFLWFFSLKNKDFNQYDQVFERTNIKFKKTTNQLESIVQNWLEKCSNWDPDIPVIYGITPTYARPVQKAELTRLSHTFRLVKNFHWIVVEDSEKKSPLVSELLKYSTLNYTHLAVPTPLSWKRKIKEPKWKKPRGVSQRNAALQWLREQKNKDTDQGVIYFADDDNTYSLRLFQEMRDIKKVGIWPVGLVGGLMVEKPLIDPVTNRVTGWNSHWRPERNFPIDMAGFAVNLQHYLAHPSAEFSFNVERGFQESFLLSQLIKIEDLEPKADNCTKVYVWHTRTEEPNLQDERILRKNGKRSDENIEV